MFVLHVSVCTVLNLILMLCRTLILTEVLAWLASLRMDGNSTRQAQVELRGFLPCCIHVHVPRRPSGFLNPLIQDLAWASKVRLVSAPSFRPIRVHHLLCFKEAGRLLNAGVTRGVQDFWFEVEPQPFKNGPKSGFRVRNKRFIPHINDVCVREPSIYGFVECLHFGHHVRRGFNVQEVTVDAVCRKMLRKA